MNIFGRHYSWYCYITRLGQLVGQCLLAQSKPMWLAVNATCGWLSLGAFWHTKLYFSVIFPPITPLGHKAGLEPDQAQARPGPQLRVGLGFLQAWACWSPAQAGPSTSLIAAYRIPLLSWMTQVMSTLTHFNREGGYEPECRCEGSPAIWSGVYHSLRLYSYTNCFAFHLCSTWLPSRLPLA